MKVLVGSKNPVKIKATKEAFLKYFPKAEISGLAVRSGVPSQPINIETFRGAKNRSLALKRINRKMNLKASFFVGIEGGIINLYSRWFAFGAMCIIDKAGRISFGSSPHFELPAHVTKKLLAGTELGDVMDELRGEKNTKQKDGAIGFFTKGIMSRKDFYVHGLVVALVPFISKELYFRGN